MITVRRFTKIGRCELHPTARICDGAIVGKLFRPFLDGTHDRARTTVVKKGAYIGYNSIIGNGSTIGSGTIIDDFTVIESRVVLGDRSLVIYRAQVCNDARIGSGCVIGGFIGERTKIGKGCRVFGKIIHLQHDPQKGWDDEDVSEPAATIRDNVFVGFDAIVAGGITIGRKAYICAGTVVTKDVPDKHIACGINKFLPFSKWNGRLKRSEFFREKR